MQTDQLATAEKIRDFVLMHLDKHYSPTDLAAMFDVSERFINRTIKKLLTKSLAESLHEKRMEQAVLLLQEGHPQKQIAALLGYTSDSHFSAAFKTHYGCAPNVYLKKK